MDATRQIEQQSVKPPLVLWSGARFLSVFSIESLQAAKSRSLNSNIETIVTFLCAKKGTVVGTVALKERGFHFLEHLHMYVDYFC